MTQHDWGPWRPDPLLAGYECAVAELSDEPLEGEPDGPLVATLIRPELSSDPERDRRRRAVVYVHGWNDYFFHTHLVDFFASIGITAYGLDLRRYGRSRRPGQIASYVDDLTDYHDELDRAWRELRRRHPSVAVMAHSTGGLAASLWAAQRPDHLDALILNSPWLDIWGPSALAGVLRPVLGGLSQRNAMATIKLPDDGGIYPRTLHASLDGEWDFDRELKSYPSAPIRVGWLRAILAGQAEVAGGLDLDMPVLMACSTRSANLNRWSDAALVADVVLDVEKLVARAPALGPLVTILRVEDGLHDLTLSPPRIRERFFAEITRWVVGYWPDAAS